MGPLAGVTVLELAGLGALPYGAMLLADMGAEVVRIDRPGAQLPVPSRSGDGPRPRRGLDRGRRVVGIDLKRAEGVETVLRMVERADALVEAYRPGVAERLGLGPEVCRARNPRLVYGRLT